MAKASSNEMDMLHGPLLSKIIIFAIPVALSGVLQQLFNAVDSVFAGQFLGPEALAAIGGNVLVITLFLNLFMGLSVGANAVIARYIGEGHRESIQDAVHTVVVLSLVCGIAMIFVGILTAEPLLVLIATPANVLDLAVLYMDVYFVGMLFILFYNFGSAILRSKGDTKRPLYALIVSGLSNIVLNYVFVAIVPWGVAGLALATTISNGIAAIMILHWLLHESEEFRLFPKQLRVNGACLKAVLAIGVPAGLQGVLFSLSNVCVQSGINSFGSAAVAGSAAAVNAECITYFVITAFVQAAVTFVAQNYAAGEVARCKKVVGICMACALICGFTMDAAFVLCGEWFLAIFTSDPAAVEYGWIRLYVICALQWLVCTYEITAGALRGLGSSLMPAVVTLIGTCVLRFAWVFFVFPLNHDLTWLLTVYPVSWIVTGISMIIGYLVVSRRKFALVSKEA